MASGCLSLPKSPDIDGSDRFGGAVYFTSRWPHEGVDFTGQRVAVIGTGSSGIQSIPLIAEQAAQLTVFQRTPNFSIPAHNGPVRPATLEALDADRDAYREGAKWSRGGIPGDPVEFGALQLSDEERLVRPRGRLGHRRAVRDHRRVQRRPAQPGGQRDRRRLHPGQDPLDRARSRDRRVAVPDRPSVRHEAAVSRHELLRHLQPAPRPPRRSAQAPDRHDHRDRHRHRRRARSSSTRSSTRPGSTR